MPSVTVVIPFYQKQTGILSRALDSVFGQSGVLPSVIVVDDASPVPAEPEIVSRASSEQARVTLVRQANAGPGGARNTGLDRVPDDTTHVAFLDSDDVWHSGHLAAALDAMDRFEADCCFATIAGGEGFDYHSTVDALEGKPGFTALSHEPLTLAADGLASRMLEDWSYLHLSCMVMTPLVFRTVRFDPELRLAAEDILFMNESVSMARRTILSGHAGALRGEGANIFHGITNTAPSYLAQQYNTVRALKLLSRRATADDAGSAALAERSERARREALWGQVARSRRGKAPQLGLLARWARTDPAILRSAARLCLSKFRKQ
ncbi:hypothetical protein LA66_18280 [Aureimonas altamirensis]|uniref:Glycosyltransferase 2-like domain-containing protein n=1 Tax=Aureimonas altamirensis TaxID=370622 RepID=A0A0B1PZ15_9HYPH|nr:glycosyltransferase family 2 protein [Aureimonas altamirensis]KHJ53349.1 hypothetical protein LA66_18280 [Aureimonas altamirensis]